MLQQKKLIREYDVEIYDIVLPFKFLCGRRRKAYLCSELEKRHPCFSDEFCFDVKFRKISKAGILADVIVIHKRKLAEYEGKLGGTGTGFFIENQRQGRVFVSRRIKMFAYVFVCGLTVLCFFSVITLIAGCASVNEENGAGIVREGGELVDAGGRTDTADARGAADVIGTAKAAGHRSIGKDFFDLLVSSEKNYGNGEREGNVPRELYISYFEWRVDGFRECISAELENVFPEVFDELKRDINRREAVSYAKGVPYMKVEYSQKILVDAAGTREKSSTEVKQGVPTSVTDGKLSRAVRELLGLDDAVLISETFVPYTIDFQLPDVSSESVNHLFEKLNELICAYGKTVSYVSIMAADQHGVKVKIQMDENLPGGVNASFIDGNLHFFIKAASQPEKAQTVVHQSNNTPVIIEGENKLKKIGEIRSGAGTSTVFYKNSDGKIIRKMEVL